MINGFHFKWAAAADWQQANSLLQDGKICEYVPQILGSINIDLVYCCWFGCIMNVKWTTWYCLLSFYTYNYMLSSIYEVTFINWDTIDSPWHYIVTGTGSTYKICSKYSVDNFESGSAPPQKKIMWHFMELPSKGRNIYRTTPWLRRN